jgi:hypothetical protein
MKAKPTPSSGRRLSPRLRLKGEYRRERRDHPPRDSASCPGSLMSRTRRGWAPLLADWPDRQALHRPQDLHGAERAGHDVVHRILPPLPGAH